MVAVGAIPLSFIKKCFRNTEISVETITTNWIFDKGDDYPIWEEIYVVIDCTRSKEENINMDDNMVLTVKECRTGERWDTLTENKK